MGLIDRYPGEAEYLEALAAKIEGMPEEELEDGLARMYEELVNHFREWVPLPGGGVKLPSLEDADGDADFLEVLVRDAYRGVYGLPRLVGV